MANGFLNMVTSYTNSVGRRWGCEGVTVERDGVAIWSCLPRWKQNWPPERLERLHAGGMVTDRADSDGR